jgi:hypothetical protein
VCKNMFEKKVRSKAKYIYIEKTFEKCIKEQDPREACKYMYLGILESYDMQHKNKKEKLRRLRSVLGTELSAKNWITGGTNTQIQFWNC